MKKLLFISTVQFGINTDMVKYCKYLTSKYDITIICPDEGYDKYKNDKISMVYLQRKNRYLYTINFIAKSIYIAYKSDIDIIFIKYNKWANIIRKLTPSKKHIIDIRSGAIIENKLERSKINNQMKNISEKFGNITIVSESLREYIGINKELKVHILPLGGEVSYQSNELIKNKEFSFIYVGILTGRNINDVLKGYLEFKKKNDTANLTKLIIIGFHYLDNAERSEFFTLVNSDKSIVYMGKIPNNEIDKYIKRSHVGISYIPKNEYFNCQPPTKTFEYLCNGIPCIATSTKENQLIINSSNGLLIDDNISSVSNALFDIYNKYNIYQTSIIKCSVAEYSWKNICKNFNEYLDSI